MAKIAIASSNLTKVRGIESAFKDVIKASNIDIVMRDVNSEVSNQPLDEEVQNGAQNRLKNLKAQLSEDKGIDYFISCEGGIIYLYGSYFNTQCVIVEDRNGNRGIGWSQAYPIPERYIAEITKTSLATVLDKIFEGKGGIRVLSNGAETRENLVREATIMSLTAIINGGNWN